jgi:aspartyl-tRNA(Asn)/glutamyl-tRNA(Gln) amidotransferase subunit B
VADYLKGKETAARFLVGQVMRITGGKAKPELANRLVQEGLASLKNPPVVPPCKEDSAR